MPDLHEITVEKYIRVRGTIEKKDDYLFLAELLECDIDILEDLHPNEYHKLVILGRRWLEIPVMSPVQQIDFLPIGSYPFGQYADWMQQVNKYNGDYRCIPFTLSLLHKTGTLIERQTTLMDWAYSLPAHVGIYYHEKIISELQNLKKNFATLEGSGPNDVEIKAGIEHLSKYGDYLTLLNLSQGDILKVREIAKLTVNEVLTYICASKDLSTYQRELSVLRKKNGV